MGKKKLRKDQPPGGGLSRRGFISTVGAGAVAVSAARGVKAGDKKMADAGDQMKVVLNINGRTHKVHVEPRFSLLYVMREIIGLTGAKPGCERGECGACTVLIDGKSRYACLTLAVEAEGTKIETVEGLMNGEDLGLVQQAFVEEDGFQCGFCTSGQVVAVEALLRDNPDPEIADIRAGLSGNLCRCGAYKHIFNSALTAAEKKRAGGGQ